MKASPKLIADLTADLTAVVDACETRAIDNVFPFNRANLSMRDMWDALHIANIDRNSEAHPRHTTPGHLPRVLPYTGHNTGLLNRMYDAGFNDATIETALKAVRKTLA